MEHNSYWNMAPPFSSPPSSPPVLNDSSPASSPGPWDEDMEAAPADEDAGHFSRSFSRENPHVHPLAASAGGFWDAPDYEKGAKRRHQRKISPSSAASPRKRAKKARLFGPRDSTSSITPISFFGSGKQEEADFKWDEAIQSMFQTGNGKIDLDDQNISEIPAKYVYDMCAFFVPPSRDDLPAESSRNVSARRDFTKAITSPAILESHETDKRIENIPRNDIQLYLAKNQISRVPIELFLLERLAFLSLRNNDLTYLPPEIRQLKNLRELNLSGNKLRFLPAEIMNLTLNQLHVFPNNFLDPPVSREFRRVKSIRERRVGATQSNVAFKGQRVPSLMELCYRLLLESATGPASISYDERKLAKYYEFPLPHDFGTTPIREVLRAIHPRSVVLAEASSADDSFIEPDDEVSVGCCPSPHHTSRLSLFVHHAEERFTWDGVVAGCHVGGSVPLRWRGCLPGCLDHLDPPPIVESTAAAAAATAVPSNENADDQSGITRVQFAPQTGFGEEDFDD